MTKRKNILFFFVDQQRFDTIGALGNPIIKTPNLDQLVQEGVTFTNAFTPSAVCVAARASMTHGLYPHHTGYYANHCMNPNIKVEEKESFMGVLTKAGYRTHGIGKCHFAPNLYDLRGFETREIEEGYCGPLDKDDYIQFLSQQSGTEHVDRPYGIGSEMYYIPQVAPVSAENHFTQWVGNRSIHFIEQEAKEDRPWYLYAGFIHPHPPFTPPSPWHLLYKAADMPLPHVPQDSESLLTFINRIQNRYKGRDQGIDQNLMRAIKAYYYACISFIDYQVGRVIQSLKETGQYENTMIVFSSDHGEMLGDYNSVGKRSYHDASSRIPLIIRDQDTFTGGKVSKTAVSLVDIAPTFTETAETTFNSHELDGIDLRTCIEESEKNINRTVYAQYAVTKWANLSNSRNIPKYADDQKREEVAATSQYMAVNSRYKYAFSAPDDREFLFDRIQDPLETRNRAGVVHHNETLAAMRENLIDHLVAGGETAGIEGNNFKHWPRMRMDENPDAGLLQQEGHTPWTSLEIPGYTIL